jgi:hypothetical protein
MPVQRALIAALQYESTEIRRIADTLRAEIESLPPDEVFDPRNSFARRLAELKRRNEVLARRIDIAASIIARLGHP